MTKKKKKAPEYVEFDLDINATLRMMRAVWESLVEEFDGDEDEALYDVTNSVESSTLDTMYGEAWVCSADGSMM